MKKKNLALCATLPFVTLQADSECCDPCFDDCISPQYNMTLSVDGLYWQANEEGLEYIIKNQEGVSFIDKDGDVKRIDCVWDWGARVAFTYETPCIMDFSLRWTYFGANKKHSTHVDYPSSLYTIWTVPGSSITPSTAASARWKLRLNLFDLQMSGLFTPSCFLTLRPFVGLSGGWINQRFTIHTSGGVSRGGAALNVLDDEIKMKNNFWGVGPQFGLNTNWTLGCGFDILANASASILYGRFSVEQYEEITFENFTPSVVYLDIDEDRLCLSRLNLNFLLGLEWSTLFCDGCYGLSLYAGWEHMLLFGQNQLKRYNDDINPGINTTINGDLTLQGLTFGASFSF